MFTRVGFYDRLTGSITYFNKNTYDLLQPVPISSTTGHKYVYQNAGEMQNSGIELQFDYTILNYEDYSLSFGFNLATLRNRVTKLQHEKKTGSVFAVEEEWTRTDEGHTLNEWYLYPSAGVDLTRGYHCGIQMLRGHRQQPILRRRNAFGWVLVLFRH